MPDRPDDRGGPRGPGAIASTRGKKKKPLPSGGGGVSVPWPTPAFLSPPPKGKKTWQQRQAERQKKARADRKIARDIIALSPAEKLRRFGFAGATKLTHDVKDWQDYDLAVRKENQRGRDTRLISKALPDVLGGKLTKEQERAFKAAAARMPEGPSLADRVHAALNVASAFGKDMDLSSVAALAQVGNPYAMALAAFPSIRGAVKDIGKSAGGDALDYLLHDAWKASDDKKLQQVQKAGIPVPTIQMTEDAAKVLGRIGVGAVAGGYGFLTGPGRVVQEGKDTTASMMQLPGLLLAMSDPRTSKAARKKLTDEFYKTTKEGLLEQYGPDTPWGKTWDISKETPITSIATAVPVAGAGSKAISAARIMGKTGLGLSDAMKAVSDPTRIGNLRTIEMKGGPRGRSETVEIPWARSPLVRPLQRGYDAISRALPEGKAPRTTGRISESRRAARVVDKRVRSEQRVITAEMEIERRKLKRLDNTEQAKLLLTRERPPGMSNTEWLGILLADTRAMINGREIIAPEAEYPSVLRAKKKVERLQARYEKSVDDAKKANRKSKLEDLRTEVSSSKSSVRALRERAENPRLTEAQRSSAATKLAAAEDRHASAAASLALAEGKHVVPVEDSPHRDQFEQAMREAGLDEEQIAVQLQVADAMARAIMPDDPAGWYATRLMRSEFGGEVPEHALFQEAGPVASITGRSGMTREQINDAFEGGYALLDNSTGETVMVTSKVLDDGSVRVEETHSGEGYVAPANVLSVRGEPPQTSSIFYSQAQRVVDEKMPPKATPQQVSKLLEKNGVKPEEMEWTNFNDWVEVLEESGVKSLTKAEVINYFSSDLNAFDLSETLLSEGGYEYRTSYGPRDKTGTALGGVEGDYKELLIRLRGPQVYTHGHWSGVSNPLVHIRFFEYDRPDGTRGLLIDEIQSDWQAAIRQSGARPKDWEAQRDALDKQADGIKERVQKLVGEALGLPSDEVVLAHGQSTLGYLVKTLDTDVDAALREQFGLDTHADIVSHQEAYALWNEWMSSPPRKNLARLERVQQRMLRRSDDLRSKASRLSSGTADAPYKGDRWRQLALKRMMAYAVEHGYDTLSWVDGRVHAVRYGHLNEEDLGHRESGDAPEDDYRYPDRDDYSSNWSHAEHEFEAPPELSGHQQRLLFREDSYGNRITYNEEADSNAGVPIEQTQPTTYPADSQIATDYDLTPGNLIVPDDGPLAGVLVKVLHVDPDGNVSVGPSGIYSIEVRGRSYGQEGEQEWEVEYRNENGWEIETETLYGDLTDVEPMGGELLGDWWDDLARKGDQNWDSELDQDSYDNAVSEFMEDWEGSGGEWEASDITSTDVSHLEGNTFLYNSLLPKDASKLWGKKYGVEVKQGTVDAMYTKYGEGDVSTQGPVGTWEIEIPDSLKQDVRAGQALFQSGHNGFGVKGAVELLGEKKFALRLFEGADVTTVIHELGHIGLHDLDPDDLMTIERELASGKPLNQWVREDHERFARAWERFFIQGGASTTALHSAFEKLQQWMQAVYRMVRGMDAPVSPEVARVFERRLGKVDLDEGDIVRFARATSGDKVRLAGHAVSQAKTELESLQQRLLAMREHGTDPSIRAEIAGLEKQLAGDPPNRTEILDSIADREQFLERREALRETKAARRLTLLRRAEKQLEDALAKPDSPEYEAAVQTADYMQADRERIIIEALGEENYEALFANRRGATQRWMVERGLMGEEDMGPATGRTPFTREKAVSSQVKRLATPTTGRMGPLSKRKLKLQKKNEMILWQLGDYRADSAVLMEEWQVAKGFQFQMMFRDRLFAIGEDVPMTGPTPGYYLMNRNGKALPRDWDSTHDAELMETYRDALDGTDTGALSDSLDQFARNWITDKPDDYTKWAEETGYDPANVRQVHPSIVEALLLPYQSRSPVASLIGIADVAATLARVSLIYTNPGYIPSNVLANLLMALGSRGALLIGDLYDAGALRKNSPDDYLMVQAHMGQAFSGSLLPDTGVVQLGRTGQRRWADFLQKIADDPFRVAIFLGNAKRRGFSTPEEVTRLLKANPEKDPALHAQMTRITEQAVREMIDFDKLSPFERRYIQPVFFVWPFLRGAYAWPIDYLKHYPERAGLIVTASAEYGESQREELGEVPNYMQAIVPIDEENGVGYVSNMGSVSPTAPLTELLTLMYSTGASLVGGEKMPSFVSLTNLIAPQYVALADAIQGRNSFGGESSLRDSAKEIGMTMVTFWGLIDDVLDEEHPKTQLDQGFWLTLLRKTVRFAPQRVSIELMNQQAEARGEKKTPQQKGLEKIGKARSAWKHVSPTTPLPRAIEDSYMAYEMVSDLRTQLKDQLGKEPGFVPEKGHREPVLSELQEATIVYDVFNKRLGAMVAEENLPDPEDIWRQYGDNGVKTYRKSLEKVLFQGKTLGDKAVAAAKKAKAAEAS